MAVIFIDNVPYETADGQNLLAACLSLGFHVPHFCWHPAIHSVGACRQCAVKQFRDESDTRGFIVMSCMSPATDGVRISIDDPDARKFRARVIEWLMLNHPHDCPVCDEGGECHLQDMTVMTGHNYRRSRAAKRTYRNQDLGPFINHEMNRCIQCYRCVRYYRDYAGGRDFDAFGIHRRVYFGRFKDGPLESEFSGNLVEVCPTGVFTDKTLRRHYTRKWDLQAAPSVCVHCGVGCNIIPGERYGLLRRIANRYNHEVNGYFLCDRGRFGYEFVNGENRIREPLLRKTPEKGSPLVPVTEKEALAKVAAMLSLEAEVIGIGAPRASLEANHALRSFVGADRFYTGMSERESELSRLVLRILSTGPAKSASLRDIETADAVLVLGEDVVNTAPRAGLALRQAAREKAMAGAQRYNLPRWDAGAIRELVENTPGALFIASCRATRLDDAAVQTVQAAPDDLARLGCAVAAAIDPSAPAAGELPESLRAFAATVASELSTAERPLVVSGISLNHSGIVQAAANIALSLCKKGKDARISVIVPECNTLGVSLLGGGSIEEAFHAAHSRQVDAVVILENDLYRRAEAADVTEFLTRCRNVIVLDHVMNRTAEQSDAVLPVATFAESDGTLVNAEGRAQRFFRVFVPEHPVQASWRTINDLMVATGGSDDTGLQSLDDITADLAWTNRRFSRLAEVAPPASFRQVGRKVPRQSHRYSGRTAVTADVSVHEDAPHRDPDTALAFSMEGTPLHPPPPLLARYWAPGWNSVQALLRYQATAGGPLKGADPGIRLLEPTKDGSADYYSDIPSAFSKRPVELLFVPAHAIFGSEELSASAPGIAERSPEPWVEMTYADAQRFGLKEAGTAAVTIGGFSGTFRVRIALKGPEGLAALSVGLPSTEFIALPAWGSVATTEVTTVGERNGHD